MPSVPPDGSEASQIKYLVLATVLAVVGDWIRSKFNSRKPPDDHPHRRWDDDEREHGHNHHRESDEDEEG